MTTPASSVHQILGPDDSPYEATACFNLWIGFGPDVFAFPREGNSIVPFVSGEEYFTDLIKACDAATTTEVMILGWQVNWDALLAPGLRLYDLVLRCAARGVKFFIMPWDDSNPIQTYDDQTKIVLESINDRLGLDRKDRRVEVQLSWSLAEKNNGYYSHHQKCVVVNRSIAYVGGIDIAYGRYDDATYTLRADAAGRSVLNRYNPCVAWIGTLERTDATDPDDLSGAELPGTTKRVAHEIHNGGHQVPYLANLPINAPKLERNREDRSVIDARVQPRMPWQDIHSRIEGPAVGDLVRNFVMRWNIDGATRLPMPAPPEYWEQPGKAKIQVLRSAPAKMRKHEYKALTEKTSVPEPQGTDDGIHQAMIRLIDNAAHFIYIESQFFVSDFGREADFAKGDLSPAGMFINSYSVDGKPADQNATARGIVSAFDDDSRWRIVRNGRFDPGLDREDLLTPPKNEVCQALIRRIKNAIFDRTQPNFHVYITLPVHPEGTLCTASIAVQVYWTMQTLVFGSHSLLNGIRRALKARELADKKHPYEAVLQDADNTAYEDIPIEACFKYVTLLNLRNWEQLGDRYVTEQIYVHSKLMIVDDRYALLGSANINDRSLLGERDSELAVLVMDNDHGYADIGLGRPTLIRTFARDLRMKVWNKLFGITGRIRPADQLQQAVEQPVNPASWQAIQKQAAGNADAYEMAFPFVPRNWSGFDDNEGKEPCSILATWDRSRPSPSKATWQLGNLASPMPFQPETWYAANHRDVSKLLNIKGYFTTLPVHWTKGENLRFAFPTSLVARNERGSGDAQHDKRELTQTNAKLERTFSTEAHG